ncbi:glyoxalase superfamily protein [Chitinophaga barathri]|uniref:Bleomycin resistance family protein n=1 Tax=Chitinophaga barathri TaxID=1647451 RepID=A0A3N4N3T9_9BACT|nr:glyoxalase superfamily protein [Chitinophaga barathri]RPD42283.1 bleomycin resistance family protein [Chitinophaga barathri]
MKFQFAVPILYAANVAESLRYFTEVLGFEGHWGWENPPTFGGVYREHVAIYFCEGGQGQPGTWLAVNLENVDEYYEEIKTKGAKILSAPEDKEWHMREMLVEAPDGHMIRFGHRI